MWPKTDLFTQNTVRALARICYRKFILHNIGLQTSIVWNLHSKLDNRQGCFSISNWLSLFDYQVKAGGREEKGRYHISLDTKITPSVIALQNPYITN